MKKILVLFIFLSLFSTLGVYTASYADNEILVRVGVYENEPKIFTDEYGKVSGFWPDIITNIASQEGWDIQYIHGTWAESLDRLKNNEIDIMPDVAYSDDREGIYSFSRETVYVSWSRVYVPEGTEINALPDLEGKKIAVLKGSINVEGPDGIKKLVSSFDLDSTFIETDSYLSVFKLLQNKQVDAGVVSKDFGYLHREEFNVTETAIVFQPVRLYFAFPPESDIKPYLMERLDYQVKTLKADGNSLYFQVLDKWLGVGTIDKPVIPDFIWWILIGIAALVILLGSGIGMFQYQVKRKTKELAEEITEHKRTENILRLSEEKYRSTLDSMMEGCQIIDFDWRYVYLNDPAIEHSRRKKEEMLGRTMMEIYPGIENHGFFSDLKRCMEARTPKRNEYLFSYADGFQGWLEICMEPVPEGLFLLSLDINEKKQAEKALRESEEKLRDIFEAVPEGISIVDLNNIVLDVNQAVVKMHGLKSKAEMVGEEALAYVAEKDKQIAVKFKEETLKNGIVIDAVINLLRKDGSEFPAELSAAVIKDEMNNPTGLIAITTDITGRMQASEEHQKIVEYRELDRVKTNLLSTISHELRTPLASIKGYSSLLLMYDHKLNKEQKHESIEAIDRSTDRLTELIDHLLDISRLEAGILKLTIQPVKPREIITTAVDETKLRSPQFHFKKEITGRIPTIMADGRRLRQVIDNILENAVKYSPENTEITAHMEVKGDDLLISIADQGRGIDRSEFQKIFERMYRIEQRLQKDPGGLGLGLSLCKALVEAHHGRIWVESELGRGSTFFFTIPLKTEDKGNENGEGKPAKTGTGN
jgi:PAS domain S-box-containing protein